MKKLKSLLGVSIIGILGIAATAVTACSTHDSSTEGSVGTAAMQLSASGPGGSTYCMMGDIVLTGTNGTTGTYTLSNNTCTPSALTIQVPPGDYTVSVPSPSCSVLNDPAGDPVFAGTCSVGPISPNPVTITVGSTSNVSIAVTYEFQQADSVTVVFGVGAAQFTITPSNHVTNSCGGALSGQLCQNGTSMCLALNASNATPHCYTLCDFVENGSAQDNCPNNGDTCIPVALPAAGGAGGAAGAAGAAGAYFTTHVGDSITSLDNTQGVCIPAIPAAAGAGGSGGAPAAGNGGQGGLAGGPAAGSGGAPAAGNGGVAGL